MLHSQFFITDLYLVLLKVNIELRCVISIKQFSIVLDRLRVTRVVGFRDIERTPVVVDSSFLQAKQLLPFYESPLLRNC